MNTLRWHPITKQRIESQGGLFRITERTLTYSRLTWYCVEQLQGGAYRKIGRTTMQFQAKELAECYAGDSL